MERTVRYLVFIAVLAAAAIALVGVDCDDPGDIHHFDYLVMGTRAQGEIYVWDRTARQSPVHVVQATFDSVNTRLSSWSETSEVGRFNAAPVGTTVSISRWLSSCLRVSGELNKVSGGAFDPSALPLTELWGFRTREGHIPTAAELAAARALLGGYDLDPFQRTLTKTLDGARIDLGGIAKGFAVDRAVANLIEFGTSSALIDLGGNIYALGLPDDKEAWRVGVRDPRDPDELLASFDMVNRAAATSGAYERYVEIDGHRYGHVLNPATGRPAEGLLSATAICRSATLADALSTTLFVLGPERALALLHESYPHVDAVLVLPAGADGRVRVLATNGLRNNLRLAPGADARYDLAFMDF